MSRSQSTYYVLERLFGRRALWRLGRWLYCGARREFASDLAANGEYALQARLARYLAARPHPAVIFDVGANLGGWARPMGEALAEAGAAGARLIAFEPGPGQRSRLETNLSGVPGFADVRILPFAIGAENGPGAFELTGEDTGSSGLVSDTMRKNGDRQIVEVDIRTIDDQLAGLQIDRVDFIKVDTEGNDPNVLFGAKGALGAGVIGAMQFEYNWRWLDFRFCLKDIFLFAEELDYEIGKITPDGIELYRDWHFELDRFVMTNFILIRRDMCGPLNAAPFRFDAANVSVPDDPAG